MIAVESEQEAMERFSTLKGQINLILSDYRLREGENPEQAAVREILEESDGRWSNVGVEYETFDTRAGCEIPGLEYDAYISSGGPGSPFDTDRLKQTMAGAAKAAGISAKPGTASTK